MTSATRRRIVAWPVIALLALAALRWARRLDDDPAPAQLYMQLKLSERRLEPGHLPVVTVVVKNFGDEAGRIPEPFLRHAVVRVTHGRDSFQVCKPKGVRWWGTSTSIPGDGEVTYQIPERMFSACVGSGTSGDYSLTVNYEPPELRHGGRPPLWQRRYWQGQLAETTVFHVKTPEETRIEEIRRRRGPPSGLCARLDRDAPVNREIWVIEAEGDRQVPGPVTRELDSLLRGVLAMDSVMRDRDAPKFLGPHFDALVALLHDPLVNKRYWGVYLLGELGGEDSVRALMDLLERERDIQVVGSLLQTLAKMERPEILPSLISLLDCQAAPPWLRESAWNLAGSMGDGRVADAMLELWETSPRPERSQTLRTLGRLKDRRGFKLAVEDLALGDAATLRATGSPEDVEQVMAALRRQTMDPWRRVEVLKLIVEWSQGSPEALGLAGEVFDQAEEGVRNGVRNEIATMILKAQLDPTKPPPLDHDRHIPSGECMSWDEWYATQAPFAQREVGRLLAPENGRFFQAAGFGRQNDLGGPFNIVSRVSPPAERVDLWRKVLALFEGASPNSLGAAARFHVHRQLILALLSLASAELPADPDGALRLLSEADAIGTAEPKLAAELRGSLEPVRERTIRLQGPDTSGPVARLPGRFRLSGGFAGGDLVLEDGGRYRLTRWSDVPPRCPGDNIATGAYVLERGWVVVTPDRPNGYLDVAEAYQPVTWGGEVYLVQHLENFCRSIEDVRKRAAQGPQPNPGMPSDFCERLRSSVGAYREAEPMLSPDECIPASPPICDHWR